MKPYELTDEEIENMLGKLELRCTCGLFDELALAVGRLAQKKLLKWLAENDLLMHPTFTGSERSEPCKLCQLLKDFGIS